MERNLFKPFIIIASLMILSVIALVYTVDVKLNFVPGVTMKLPARLEGWTGNELRFCHNPKECALDYKDAAFYVSDLALPDICPVCGEKLYHMARAEREILPKDTEFVKSAYTNDTGTRIFTSIVLSGTARDSIHRPQRCLKGQGSDLVGEYDLNVPLDGRDPLTIRVIKAERIFQTEQGSVPYYSYFAYWFVGQDRETPSHYTRMFWLGWDRVIRSTAHRWSYISVSGEREETGNAYEAEILDYVRKMYPHILTESMRAKFYPESNE